MSDPKVSAEDIQRIAHLARLRIPAEATAQWQDELGRMLAHVAVLGDLATQDVQPLTHATELQGAERADAIVPSLPVEKALDAAPARVESASGEGFQVPKVL